MTGETPPTQRPGQPPFNPPARPPFNPPAHPPFNPPARPPFNPPARPPVVDLTEQTRATQLIADRSRSAGIWSLGHLKLCWAALLAGGLVLGVIAAIASGLGAVLGVVLGTAIVGIFFTVSAVVIAHVGFTNPNTVMLAALFTYVIKVVALGIVLVAMPTDGLVNTRWMAGAIGLGLFCWLGAHMRYVWTLKIFYVDPG